MSTENKPPHTENKKSQPETLSAWERWQLPSMDADIPVKQNAYNIPTKPKPGQEVAPVEEEQEVKPLTAEDLEVIRQAAYEEGLLEGREAGRQEGYQQGLINGESDVKAAVTKLSQICRTLLEPIPKQDQELEKSLLELVEQICRRVVHRELTLDSSSLAAIVREAIDCLNPGSERLRIHLNHEDTEFVLAKLKEVGEWDDSWRILAHPTITPGGCIIETDSSMVDARAERRLAMVIQQVYEQQEKALQQRSQQHGHVDQLMDEVAPFTENEEDSLEDLSSLKPFHFSESESDTDSSTEEPPENGPQSSN